MIEMARKDDVNEVMPLILSAIGDIAYSLSGTNDDDETWQVLSEYYNQEINRISYRNVIVDRRDGQIAGMLISYLGDKAEELDNPIKNRLMQLHGEDAANEVVMECLQGDYYLDSVAVDERFRGQGIASELITAFEQRGRSLGCTQLSLIVEGDNNRAFSLYERLGYKEDGTIMVSGSEYTRMVK
ncbi:GNAT family N-acetyltransferase [Paenibacillus sp. GSMTC-2017]|uniref:GNAT family N-acetyltransferase n=1 Tax=Paenibacillus sp. GSMTC-2017 TaxID=2794350 RepID=UPI0018D9F98E|nr:GNAT family N-acetyltransferase [Paenibacillus sp. GSMTC-2017]MBH5317393.1 GNAT family N-acetyltransferase [Paenibacillus sp. GSMTC-2017]